LRLGGRAALHHSDLDRGSSRPNPVVRPSTVKEAVIASEAKQSRSAVPIETVALHGERRGLAHVEIEIRQDLITTPIGQREWAERLVRLLPAAYAEFQRR
jgi:predicted N-formylglutamate amidohydrolase